MEELLIWMGSVFSKNRIFDTKDPQINRDNVSRPIQELKHYLWDLGYDLKTADTAKNFNSAKQIIFQEVPFKPDEMYFLNKASKAGLDMNLILYEPYVVRPKNYDKRCHEGFTKVLTWNDDLVDGKKYVKNNFTMPYFEHEEILIPNQIPFEKRKLLCLVSANKYSQYSDQLYTERVTAIRFMEKNYSKEFDLYGMWWDLPVIHSNLAEKCGLNNIPKLIGKFPILSPTRILPSNWFYPSYLGKIKNKKAIMGKYKFCICYENQQNAPGYISEKILDAFTSGCVPVYLGANNIERYIPKSCFIDKREFKTYSELYTYLSSMSHSQFSDHLSSINSFLNSKKSSQFKIDYFISNVAKLVN